MKFLSLKGTVIFGIILLWSFIANGQADFPQRSYRVETGFFKLPDHFNFGEVSGVVLDQRGHIFIFNRGPQPLVEFTASGKFVRTIGDGLFENSHGLRIDPQGNLWTTDVTTNVVLRLNREGHVTLVLGRKGRTGETEALFNQPTDVAFGPKGEIFVADGYGNSRIVKFDREGNFVNAWGKKGHAPGEFNLPHTMVVDPRNRLIVGDRDNMRIQLFDLDGNFIAQWTHAGSPWGLELTADGFLFMVDGYANRVVKLDLDGNVLGAFGAPGKTAGRFAFAHSIAIGRQGEIFVAEILNWRVQKFIPMQK